MFVCEDCGKKFNEPITNEEYDTGYRSVTCPFCGGDMISELSDCLLCGEPTESEYDDFCAECMSYFEHYVENVIREKVSENTDQVLASFYEGYPKRDGKCLYCNGGNCKRCKAVVTAAIGTACDILGCSEDEIEAMANQKYGW